MDALKLFLNASAGVSIIIVRISSTSPTSSSSNNGVFLLVVS